MNKLSIRTITFKYVSALGLLAILALSSYFILQENIQSQEKSAAIINVSGRQRMLSQRIALKAHQLLSAQDSIRQNKLRSELVHAIDLMSTSHNSLINGNAEIGLPGNPSKTVKSMLFSSLLSLDSKVKDYLKYANKIVESSNADVLTRNKDVHYLSEKSNQILIGLDSLVKQYQLESELSIAWLQRLELLIAVSFLGVLLMLALFVFRPMTSRIKEEANELKKAEEYSRTIMELSADGIIIINSEGIIVSYNQAAAIMFGYNESQVRGSRINMLVPEADCYDHNKFLSDYQNKCAASSQCPEREIEGLRQDDTTIPLAMSVSEISHESKQLFICSLRDMTERKKMEDQLKKTAITDVLTGLLNRRGFFTLSEKHCKLAQRNKQLMLLIYVDLDGMKIINDKYGHKEGDRAIIDTANILKSSFRESDIIARIGGDEFVVLLTENSDEDIEHIVTKSVMGNLKQHNTIDENRYALSLSLGIAHFDPCHSSSLEVILTEADKSMYENKKKRKVGRN